MPSKRKESPAPHHVSPKREKLSSTQWDSTFHSCDVELSEDALQLTKLNNRSWDLIKGTSVVPSDAVGMFYYEMEIVNDPCVYLGLVDADVTDAKANCLGESSMHHFICACMTL
jgi:hypothetical protein